MNKNDALDLILKNFRIESCVSDFHSTNLSIKSRVFYYNPLFKDIKNLKLLTLKSTSGDLVFTVSFSSEDFGGLAKGFFRVLPESPHAKKILMFSNTVCYDLEDYFYDLFLTNEPFKLYLITKNIQTALDARSSQDKNFNVASVQNQQQIALSNFSPELFYKGFLSLNYLYKYIEDFQDFNQKLLPHTKRFLLNLLTYEPPNNLLILNGSVPLPYTVEVKHDQITVQNKELNVPLYYFIHKVKEKNMPLYVRFIFDFGGVLP